MRRDLTWALRWLARNPLFAAGVTAILALGIGANTAVFSIVDAVLLRPLPYQSSSRLVRVDESSTKLLVSGIAAEDYLRWGGRGDLFDAIIPYSKEWITLIGGAEPDQIIALKTGGGLFPLLGVRASLGRTLGASDDNAGAPNVVVLSDRLWRRLFHADPHVIGRTVKIGDDPFTIAGVMPADFEFANSNIEMWLPLRLDSASKGMVEVIARLKPRITPARAQSAMQILARQMEAEKPVDRAGLRFNVSPWRESTDVKYERTLVFILAAVSLVLLIACADVGGLLLTRAVHRQKEIAIRTSLGAGFWRIVRQLLAESLTLTLFGTTIGITLAYYLLKFLTNQLSDLPIVLPHVLQATINGRVLGFNLVLCLAIAILCGLAPVVSVSKTDPQRVLRAGGGGTSRHSLRLFSILIASETGLAFILLVGSGLMIRSLIRLEQEDHGFRPDHVLTLRVPIGTRTQPTPAGKYRSKPEQMAFYKDLLDRVRTIPGLEAVGVVNNLPLSGVNTSTIMTGPDGKPILNSTRTISPQYFAAMGTPLLAGRDFTDNDRHGFPEVAIINEYLAHQLYPNRSAIGQVLPGEPGFKVTVVGVVKDSAQASYDEPAKAEVYRPYQQFIFAAFMSTVVARTSGPPEMLANALRREVWAVDANEPVVKIETLNDVIADSIWRPRFSAWILSVLGALALALTSAGVYSVIAYTTALRAREMGIRMALGASPWRVVRLVLRGAIVPLVAGLALSSVAALFLSRLLSSLLYGLQSSDPISYLSAAAVLVVAGVVASVRPAWKAATGDPLTPLRAE